MTTSKQKYTVSYSKSDKGWIASIKDTVGCVIAAAESESLSSLKKWVNASKKSF